jgi:hypothetical protein
MPARCIERRLAGLVLAGAAIAHAAAAEPAVTVAGGVWQISAQGADRAALARQLARASNSTLLAAPEALQQTPALSLHWRGPSLAEAWQQLLGDEVDHALRCEPRGCQVWIVGVRRRATAAAVATATRLPDRRLQPDPPGLFPAD